MNRRKVLLAMSGGVDSSAAAVILINLGYYVEGATMRLWSDDEASTEKNIHGAAEICRMLGIKHHVLDYKDEFKDEIITYFLNEYQKGRTPNPCVMCNRLFKFGRFYNDAVSLGFDFISTGHYARIAERNGKKALVCAKYLQKDQSYVLYNLKQEMLEHIIFPLGDKSKEEARKAAADFNLPSADSPESQEICFIKNDDYIEFLNKFGRCAVKSGNFIDTSGNVLGQHNGITNYTVGQRKGLGVAFGEPMYVVSINAEDNTVTLGRNEDTYSSAALCSDFNFINDGCLKSIESYSNGFSSKDRNIVQGAAVQARIRYKSPVADAYISISDKCLRVDFVKPQRAVTPGQSVVLYSGDELLGGGIIDSVIK